jgi:hypothetical protein
MSTLKECPIHQALQSGISGMAGQVGQSEVSMVGWGYASENFACPSIGRARQSVNHGTARRQCRASATHSTKHYHTRQSPTYVTLRLSNQESQVCGFFPSSTFDRSMARFFDSSHDFRIDNFQVFNGHPTGNSLRGQSIYPPVLYHNVWLTFVALPSARGPHRTRSPARLCRTL